VTGMKAINIKSKIKCVIDDFIKYGLEPEFDSYFINEFKENVQVFGGSIASMLMGEKVNDYDIYFKDFHFALKFAEKMCNIRNKSLKTSARQIYAETIEFVDSKGETGERIFIKNSAKGKEERLMMAVAGGEQRELKHGIAAITNNAISFRSDIQVIIRFTGDYHKIVKNFDFIHAQCCYDYSLNNLFIPHRALQSMLSKSLFYTGSLYPISSVIRTRKFLKRGWDISVGQLLKMAFQINNLNLDDRQTLLDQIVGVDLLYIQAFYAKLNELPQSEHLTEFIEKLLDEVFDGSMVERMGDFNSVSY